MRHDDDQHNPEHYGKAAIAVLHDKVSITIECVTCGRIEFGPVDILHVRSLGDLLVDVANKMDLPMAKSEVVAHHSGDDPGIIAEGMAEFDNMELNPNPGSKKPKNLWGLLSKFGKPS